MDSVLEILKGMKAEEEKRIKKIEDEKRKKEESKRIRIKNEEMDKEIGENNKRLEEIINDDNPDMDTPRVYECIRTSYPMTMGGRTSETVIYKVFTPRQVKAFNEFGLNNDYYGKTKILDVSDYSDEKIEVMLENAKRMVDLIKNGENPELEDKGKIINNPHYKKYSTELTLRQALLCSPEFNAEEIGFKTYREIENKQKEQEEKKNVGVENSKSKSKISLASIKKSINRVLGKGEK